MRLTLATDRLTLRPFALSDASRVSALAGDRDVARMTACIPHPYPPEAAEGWIRLQRFARRRRADFPFAIDAGGTDGLVGAVGLHCTGIEGEYELGYWLGRRYWRRGYATEAARAVIAWGREDLGVTRLTAGHFADNPASARVLEKLGFRRAGAPCLRYSLARDGHEECYDFEYAMAGEPLPAMA